MIKLFASILLLPQLLFAQISTENKTYNSTIVSPHKLAEIGKENIIYCSSFEIAWNKIKEEIIKEPIQLNKSVSWLDVLNTLPKNNSIGAEYITTIAGLGKDGVLNEIEEELKAKFNYDYQPQYSINETDIISVAYLQKDISFYSELNDDFDDEKLLFNDSIEVDFFGLKFGWANPEYKKNLRIHDYLNENDFIFQIGTKEGNDEVYFAKVAPGATLMETYNEVMKRIAINKVELLGDFEQVRIPYVYCNMQKEFAEVEGAQILNKGFETYSISKAIQLIEFNLNEAGISIRSESEIEAVECSVRFKPRILEFNKPFLIIVKEKDKNEPYFLMWVNNTELMRKGR